MAESNYEKTEAPTPRRLQEARRDGNVARSMDLNAAFVLLAGILALQFIGGRAFGGLKQAIEVLLTAGHAENPTRADDLSAIANYSIYAVADALLPMLLMIMAIALMVAIGQVGFLVTTKPLIPRLDKLSPLRGIRNMFNLRAGLRLVMNLLKITVIGGVSAIFIFQDLPWTILLVELELRAAITAGIHLIYALAIKLVVILMLLAIIDYSFQRMNRQREMRMSKDEIKREMKDFEGDPLIKQRRGQVARQLALQRISAAVPQADVVVTNPTHFAVALKYDSATMRAPRVIAKGADFMALRIRQIAVSNDVPIVERKQLAQALYRGVEIGQEIPSEHYTAVAEILAYVYRLSGQQAVA